MSMGSGPGTQWDLGTNGLIPPRVQTCIQCEAEELQEMDEKDFSPIAGRSAVSVTRKCA